MRVTLKVYIANHREEQREQGCGMEIEFTQDGTTLLYVAWRRYLTNEPSKDKVNEEFWGQSQDQGKEVKSTKSFWKPRYRHSLTGSNVIVGWDVDSYKQPDEAKDTTAGNDEGAIASTAGNQSRRRPEIKLTLEDYCQIDMSQNTLPKKTNWIQGDSEMVVLAFDNGKGDKGFQILRFGYRDGKTESGLRETDKDTTGVQVDYVDVIIHGI